MQLALKYAVRALLALPLLMTAGCLVTEGIEFPEEENLPPAVVDTTPAQTKIVRLETTDLDPEFSVTIRDANVEQTLRYVVYVDRNVDIPQTSAIGGEIPPTATGDLERTFTFAIQRALLPNIPSCHRIDLLVSAEFTFPFTGTPLTPNDIDTATWWINVRSESAGENLDGCP